MITKTDGLLLGKTISWRHSAVPPKDEFLIASMIARPEMFVLLFMGIINNKEKHEQNNAPN